MYVPLCIESRRQSQRPSEHLPSFLLDGSLVGLELNKQAKQAGSEPQPLSTPPAMVLEVPFTMYRAFIYSFGFSLNVGAGRPKLGSMVHKTSSLLTEPSPQSLFLQFSSFSYVAQLGLMNTYSAPWLMV